MNETEQKVNTGAAEDDVVAAFEREHATDGAWQPPTPPKRGKLSKTARAVVIGCITFNVLMMAVIAAIVAVKLGRTNADEPPTSEVSIDEHEGEIYIEDDVLGGMWLPKSENLKKSSLNANKFHESNGIITYDGAALGIDVSEFQTVTDWNAVKQAGVDFVMVRVGRRGYETGLIVEDTDYRRNIEGAQEAGLDVGVYFFSQAVTTNEAREEARFVLDCIKDYEISYPVVFDWESTEKAEARTFEMKNDQLNTIAHAFVDTIEEAGYHPMLYFYKYLGYKQYVLDEFADCDFWLSEPADRPTFYYETAMWQYAVDGEIPGVEGAVDLDICFKPYT
ncbi:MAG: glycoside hydrolase family 25 protein [Clostridia bacterium]|nr:glycoside hydrolase family 25 protein [Clostridia bacterium]